jgi:dolichol kinase
MKIPYNQNKSWAGSIAMLLFGFLVSIGYVLQYLTNSTTFSTVLFLLLIRKLTQLRELKCENILLQVDFDC